MQKIYTIILDLLPLLSLIACIITGFISWKGSKKVNLVNICAFILEKLPSIVSYVEGLNFSSGVEKKEAAISLSVQLISKKFGVLKEKDNISVVEFISNQIESILSTPEKKGVK